MITAQEASPKLDKFLLFHHDFLVLVVFKVFKSGVGSGGCWGWGGPGAGGGAGVKLPFLGL